MSEHDVAELLPFYANGTLDAAERARVESELATCATCATELGELRALASSLQGRADAAPPLSERAIDAAFARINAAASMTALRTSWWSAPARYATAAVLVAGIGAAAAAAYHAHEAREADGEYVTVANGIAREQTAQRVYRAGQATQAEQNVNASNASRAAAAAAPAPPPAAVRAQHRLARKAELDLLVRDVEASLKAAQSTISAAGGDVTSLSDDTPRTADAVHGALVEADVPADRLDATLERLSALGALQNRKIDAEDVDDAIVDEEARLRNLRREEADLRKLMDRGGHVGDILQVQQQLSDVRGQIEELDAQHQHDLHRVATSTIALNLTEDRPNATPAKPGPTARIDGAWRAGLTALADTITAVLATIAWCVAFGPVLLTIAAVGYVAIRAAKKRITSP